MTIKDSEMVWKFAVHFNRKVIKSHYPLETERTILKKLCYLPLENKTKIKYEMIILVLFSRGK